MGAPKGNKYALGNKGGAPPKYKTPEEMEEVIEEYFNSCWEEVWNKEYDKATETYKWVQELDRENNPVMRLKERPTVTGLALTLGFNSRQAIINYEVKKEYYDTIKKAKLLIEHYYEKGVVEGDIHPATGIFILKNFEWKDTFEVNTNKQPERLEINDIQEQLKRLKQGEDKE